MYDPEEDYQVMLNKLRTICRNKNISQYALAKATGMSNSSMNALMKGKTKPYIYTLMIICNVLDVTISDLFEKKDLAVDEDLNALIEAYNCLSSEKKQMLKVYIEMLLQYNEES